MNLYQTSNWVKTGLKLAGTVICMLVVYAAPLSRVEAMPIMFGSNAYEFIQVSNPFTNNTWSAASAATSALTLLGLGLIGLGFHRRKGL